MTPASSPEVPDHDMNQLTILARLDRDLISSGSVLWTGRAATAGAPSS